MRGKLQAVKLAYRQLRDLIVRQEFILALLLAVGIILTGLFLGLENTRVVPTNPSPVAGYAQELHNPLHFMAHWDAPDYITISQTGYTQAYQTNFFPLYTLAIRLVHMVLGSALDSALLIAWISLVGGIYFYLKVIRCLFSVKDNADAVKGVLPFLLFPTGVFLLAPYTESLFAFLALGALYYALQKKYLISGLFAAFATATHVNGVFVLVLLALLLLEEHTKLTKILTTLSVGSLGLVGYMIFLFVRYHNPLEFVSAQKAHGWLQHQGYTNLAAISSVFNILIIGLLLLAIIYWWQRRKSFAVYCFLYLCIPLLGGQFGGFNRYCLMAFPVQFMIYDRFRSSHTVFSVLIALSGILWAYYLFQYVGGYVGG